MLDLCNTIDFQSEEDKAGELAPILAQEVFVLAKLGRFDEALERSKELNVQR